MNRREEESRRFDVSTVLVDPTVFFGFVLLAFMTGFILWLGSAVTAVHCGASDGTCAVRVTRGGKVVSTDSFDLDGATSVKIVTQKKKATLIVVAKGSSSHDYVDPLSDHDEEVVATFRDFIANPKTDRDAVFQGQTTALHLSPFGLVFLLVLIRTGFAPVTLNASLSGKRIRLRSTRWWRKKDDLDLDANDVVGADVHFYNVSDRRGTTSSTRVAQLRVHLHNGEVKLLGGVLPPAPKLRALADRLDRFLRDAKGSET